MSYLENFKEDFNFNHFGSQHLATLQDGDDRRRVRRLIRRGRSTSSRSHSRNRAYTYYKTWTRLFGHTVLIAGSLFSVPILQSVGVTMASFLSNTQIVHLYCIVPVKSIRMTSLCKDYCKNGIKLFKY